MAETSKAAAARRRREAARAALANAAAELGITPEELSAAAAQASGGDKAAKAAALAAAKDAAKQTAISAAREAAERSNLANSNTKLTCRDLDTLGQIQQFEIQDDTVGIDPGIIGRISGPDQLLINPRDRIPPRIGNINIDTIRGIGETARDVSTPAIVEVQPDFSEREDVLNQLDSEDEQSFLDIPASFLSSPFLGLGRATTVIDIENYADSFEKILKDYNIEKSKIKDRIRYYNSSFYILKNQALNFLANTRDKKKFIRLRSATILEKGTLISSSVETYKFMFDDDLKVANKQLASKFKKKFISGGDFTGSILGQKKDNFNFEGLIEQKTNIADNAFIMQFPFENSETLNTLNLVGTSVVDIKESYNFYIEQYENIASSVNVNSKENVFPNLYVLNALIEGKTNQKDILSSISNLNGLIPSADRFMLSRTEEAVFGTKNNIGEYFDLFGASYNSLVKEEPAIHDSFNNKMKNIIFLSDSTNKMVEVNKKKYLFPMSVEIAIPADKTTNITRMLMDSELLDSFMMQLFNIHKTNGFESKDSAISERLYTQDLSTDGQSNSVRSTYNTKRKNINFENIASILQNIKQQPLSPSGPDYVVIGDVTKYLKTNTESMSFVNGLRNIIFNSKLNTFVRKNHRTYKDILEGKTCYNETVAFRVSKYNADETTPIQNYWIPNNPDLDFINLVDTQIKYEKEYTYKIFAYQFVLGNQINQNMSDKRASDTEFIIDIKNLPEANLMEIEILSTNKMVADTPPLSPEVLFVPYFDVDNKMGLFLNSRSGEEKLKPINILSSDKEKTSTYKKNLDNTVLFKTDDVAKRFEIMRLERKPNSYADFASGFIKVVSTDVSLETIQKATAAAFIDSIEPNKKYYYCFRVVDVHEKISNPTQIFELEILNEKGMVYPIVKNYDFEKPAYSNNIEMRRFIKIKPSSQHTFLNKEKSGIESDTTAEQSLQKIKLGVSDVGVPWGKTFKMILTSKQTGKKVEFKFKFKYTTE